MREEDTTIVFHVEPADRSVGIMSESFAAWVIRGVTPHLRTLYVEIESWEETFSEARFAWFSNHTGNEVLQPEGASMVERALHAYALGYYESRDYGLSERPEEYTTE